MAGRGFSPNDSTQTAFLAALASGESGAYSDPAHVGFGNVNLAGQPTNSTGFPIWSGATTSAGPTHAAGIYQFEPGTWNPIANAQGLNFANPQDQSAAAWSLASSKYAAKTGGGNLESALQSGDFTGVASALKPTWTSLSPSELSKAFNGQLPTGAPGTGKAGTTPAFSITSPSSWFPALDASVKNLFVRGGVFILALILIAFGLFYLADQAGSGSATATLKAAVA